MVKTLYEDLQNKKEKISVIGLGYVGLPVAIEFAKKYDVIGFDTDEEKVDIYRKGTDVTNEVGDEELQKSTITLSSKEEDLRDCKFHIVAVPTPINTDKTPNLAPIISASRSIGRNIQKGSVVVYESTVYPGTTEEICIPIIEEESGLTFGEDFKVGYSPERINPGDKVNTLTKITKVVSGSDDEALQVISDLYGSIIEAGVFEAESIRVAEAAKVIENSQRDINIAFMNELSMVFNKMGINTSAVLEAARTKWNFLPFNPGFVGGHCIGGYAYYISFKDETNRVAEVTEVNYNSQLDINIAFMNELSMVFNKMGINTSAVLEAARTKWNFLPFTPGLVGGHCIGVDPYYFTYKAEQLGYHSQIILAGRKINDNMGKHVANNIVKTMIQSKQQIHDARIAILGLTFKENVGDVRNTRVIDIINELKDYGVELLVHDPEANAEEVYEEFNISLVDQAQLTNLDAIVLAVPHDSYMEELTLEKLSTMYRKDDKKVLIDVKSVFTQKECEQNGFTYWSL